MNLEVQDNTGKDNSVITELINQFFPYSEERLGFNKPVSAELTSDPRNALDPLGKTAYYDPNKMNIVLFIDDRHPKDILRSFSHELVHHSQNCRGEFDNTGVTEEGYAQNNKHLREMEKEAYLEGQIILRDWEDSKKENKLKMDINEETIRNITRKVMENLKPTDEVRTRADGKLPTNDVHRGSHGRGRQELPEDKELEEVLGYEGDEETEFEVGPIELDEETVDEDTETLEEMPKKDSPDRSAGRDVARRLRPLEEVHDCAEVHSGQEHDEWEQGERVGPVAHTELSENKNKSNYDLFLKKKDQMLFERLTKRWCK